MTTTQTGTVTIDIIAGYQDINDTDPMARATRWTAAYTGRRVEWTYRIETPADMAADFLTAGGVSHLAELVFEADNSPYAHDPDSAVGMIQAAMNAAYGDRSDRHHSLSVGDSVQVGEVKVVVGSTGFVRVHH
jgi:hypothetical protein